MQGETAVRRLKKNKFDLMELAGACGDLGTLIPFVLAYISVVKFNPVGILFSFGLFNIITGLFYKTPIPVQPMKAIGTFSAAHPTQVTQGMISGAGLFSGIFWLLLSVTGSLNVIERIVKTSVVKGIILGLGLSFMVQGIKMMSSLPWLALAALIIFFFLQKNDKVPVILIILLLGMTAAIISNPNLVRDLWRIRPDFALPPINVKPFRLSELVTGVLLLGLPQIPLTLGNGILALAAENNQLFPDRQITAKTAAVSTGLMNLFSPFWGGVPVCHGAGGIVGHARFGARTGGATIILGTFLLTMALFFGQSLTIFLQLFPPAVLGVAMSVAGAELAVSAYNPGMAKRDFYVTVITAGTALWNAGAALLLGIILDWISNKQAGNS